MKRDILKKEILEEFEKTKKKWLRQDEGVYFDEAWIDYDVFNRIVDYTIDRVRKEERERFLLKNEKR